MMIMKKNLLIAAIAITALASCSEEKYVGNNSPNNPEVSDAIAFGLNVQNTTRAGEFVGATAAEKLGGMFVVEGTKGSEQENSPSTTVVFDNYLVGYTANTAGTANSNTNNWEYVGLHAGIEGKMSSTTWGSLHTDVTAQTVKFWDYTQPQYDFIAWSTGKREAVTGDADAVAGSKIKVTRINTGSTLATTAFTMTALSAADLQECYFTDINKVLKANYGNPVTLTFRNLGAKVRMALYETVPGYSVKNVYFYTSDANPTAPADLGDATTNTVTAATLFTMGSGVSLSQSGQILVSYPHIGSSNSNAADYNKASVTVSAVSGDASTTTQAFGALSYTDGFLGTTLPTASFAGDAANNFYTAVIPSGNGVPLTLRVDYTLVSTDGSGEEIHVYGAKAVVPATYTAWQPNYAYTYIFKISDNTNGWTSTTYTDPKGLFPITFDAMVTSFVDETAEQATVTTVATPSITTYQQGHDHANKDEYSKSQKAGADLTNVKDLYVQVMDNSVATPTLKADLNGEKKSLLFSVSKASASEAEVMDALQNRTNAYSDVSPVGRNGITLTTNANIANNVTSIINGVDDQPITKIAGTDIAAGQVAKIDIDQLAAGTYAYVYSTTVPSSDEKVYHVAAATSENYTNYYAVALTGDETPIALTDPVTTAAAGKVYFVKNVDKNGAFVSYTFKQTKVGDDVTGLVVADIPGDKASGGFVSTNFYFDVYNKNNGAYAVKVIKVVD